MLYGPAISQSDCMKAGPYNNQFYKVEMYMYDDTTMVAHRYQPKKNILI